MYLRFCMNSLFNKKFWEEINTYFPWYDTGHTENNMSNNSSSVACVFVTNPLPSNNKGIFTEPLSSNDRGDTHTQTAMWSHKPTLFFQNTESRLKNKLIQRLELDQSSTSTTEVKNVFGVYLTILPRLYMLCVEQESNHEFCGKKWLWLMRIIKITIFWAMMPDLVNHYHCFGGISYLYLQDREVRLIWNTVNNLWLPKHKKPSEPDSEPRVDPRTSQIWSRMPTTELWHPAQECIKHYKVNKV
jgi:hypothetical protein